MSLFYNIQIKTRVNIVVAGNDGTGKSITFDYFREMRLGDELSVQLIIPMIYSVNSS